MYFISYIDPARLVFHLVTVKIHEIIICENNLSMSIPHTGTNINH